MNYLDRISKNIIDYYYKTNETVDEFRKQNPDEKVLFSTRVKGREANINEDIGVNLKWANAKKGAFILTDKRMVFDRWNIELDQIKSAEYGRFLGITYNAIALRINTKDNKSFQMGTIFDPEILNQNVLNLKEIKTHPYLNLIGFIGRVSLILLIIYLLIKPFLS